MQKILTIIILVVVVFNLILIIQHQIVMTDILIAQQNNMIDLGKEMMYVDITLSRINNTLESLSLERTNLLDCVSLYNRNDTALALMDAINNQNIEPGLEDQRISKYFRFMDGGACAKYLEDFKIMYPEQLDHLKWK